MRNARGLTLVEVIVAMLLLALLGTAIIAFLPVLTRNTQASSIDTVQSQKAISIFEHIAKDWSNLGPWASGIVYDDGGEILVEDFVASEMAAVGMSCHAEISAPEPERKRIVIICPAEGGLPEWTMRAEFGDPGV